MADIYNAAALAHDDQAQARVIGNDEAPELFARMREYVPVPGDTWKEAYCVRLFPGEEIPDHTHEEWVVLYYPDPGETPVTVEGVPVPLNAGDFFVVPPGVVHAVPVHTGTRPRISIAMKVPKEG